MTELSRRRALQIVSSAVLGAAACRLDAKALPVPSTGDGVPSKDASFEGRALRAMCQGLIPIPELASSSYEVVVARWRDTAKTDAVLAAHLQQAVNAIKGHFGTKVPDNNTADMATFLMTVEHMPFFSALLSALTVAMVTLPEVWAIAGYEGESFSRGGYLQRGFNDLDWLPDPPMSVMGASP